eukprot:7015-Heterococcus_DN1.PRE.1
MEFLIYDRQYLLKDIASGQFDKYLVPFAQSLARDGGYQKVNTMADYNAAWRHILDVFKNAKAPVIWQLDHNNNNGLDDPRPIKDTWPSQDVMKDIQQVGITAYNRAYSKPNKQFTLSFKQQFGPAYYQVAALTDKPIVVAETSTLSGHDITKVNWLYEAWLSMAIDFPRVVQLTWFLANKSEVRANTQHTNRRHSQMTRRYADMRHCADEGMYLDWDINTAAELANFKKGYYEFKALTTPKRLLLLQSNDEAEEVTVNNETVIAETVTNVTAAQEADMTLI